MRPAPVQAHVTPITGLSELLAALLTFPEPSLLPRDPLQHNTQSMHSVQYLRTLKSHSSLSTLSTHSAPSLYSLLSQYHSRPTIPMWYSTRSPLDSL